MAPRPAPRALLAMLFVAAAVVPAAAAHRHRHGTAPRVTITADGSGTLIAVRYAIGAGERVRFVHARETIEHVALADVDNDGDLDILAAPHHGVLMLWRNAGHGRFALATLPSHAHRLAACGPRFLGILKSDDGWQWGDDRYDAALPRAPAIAAAIPVAVVRASSSASLHAVPVRRSSGRAPPLA